MDLIDRQAEIDAIKNWFEVNQYYHPYSKSKSIPIDELYDILKNLPTIEAEPVIMCKDCKYQVEYRNGNLLCGKWAGDPYEAAHAPDDAFCSWAERRVDGQE